MTHHLALTQVARMIAFTVRPAVIFLPELLGLLLLEIVLRIRLWIAIRYWRVNILGHCDIILPV